MKKRNCFLCVVFLTFSFGAFGLNKNFRNELIDVKHYIGVGVNAKGPIHQAHMDLGKIEMFFTSSKPILNFIPGKNNKKVGGKRTDIYIFPRSSILAKKDKQIISKLRSIKSPYYSLSVKPITKPTVGLQVSITYDPKNVSIGKPRIFKKINPAGQWGVDFRFYNQSLMQAIGMILNRGRRVASLKKKESLLTVAMEEKILGPLVVLG